LVHFLEFCMFFVIFTSLTSSTSTLAISIYGQFRLKFSTKLPSHEPKFASLNIVFVFSLFLTYVSVPRLRPFFYLFLTDDLAVLLNLSFLLFGALFFVSDILSYWADLTAKTSQAIIILKSLNHLNQSCLPRATKELSRHPTVYPIHLQVDYLNHSQHPSKFLSYSNLNQTFNRQILFCFH